MTNKPKDDDKSVERIHTMVMELHRLINESLSELSPYTSAAIRIEIMMNAPRIGTLGLFSILMKERVRRTGVGGAIRMAADITEDQSYDVYKFCVYMMLARTRSTEKDGSSNLAQNAQDALEVFALENNRPFPYLMEVESLLKRMA